MPHTWRKPPRHGRLSGGDISAASFDTPDISSPAHPRKRTAGPRPLGLGECAAPLQALVREHRLDCQLALVREHWRSCRHLWLDHKKPLKVARLGDDLPPDFWWGAGLPGLAPIKPIRGGRFEFAEGSRSALIVPCYDTIPGMLDANAQRHVEELRDLVAVDLDRPDRHWRRRGDAVVLGNAYLEIAGQEGEPVPVFRNPLTWLRSGGAGIAILDWNCTRDLLLDHELIAEDLELGDRLEANLRPDIFIVETAE